MGSGLWWQLRCKIYICGEAATTISHFSFKRGFQMESKGDPPHGYPRTPNPEPRTLNNKFMIIISVIHDECYIIAHLFISFIKTMIDTNSYRLLILRLSLVKIVLSNAKSASE